MEALGVSIDGNELKFALLRKSKDEIEIAALEKVIIKSTDSEDLSQVVPEESAEDAFGLEAAHEDIVLEGESSETDDDVILDTLSKYSSKNLKIGVNILQSDVSYTNILADIDPKDKNFRKKMKKELEKVISDIHEENYDFIPKYGNEYIAFYHNQRLYLLNQILRAKSVLKDYMKIELIDINEIALINLFSNMAEVDSGVSILLYIGNEFCRILLFQGKEIITFSPLINEGYHSAELLTNLYAKVMFEFDREGIGELNNIYIEGDGNLPQYEEFFKEKFPDCNISKLPFENFFTIVDETKKANVDAYAIPVSLAWKILDKKERTFTDTNFLPVKIRKQQKAFTISWHGFVLVMLILASIGYYYLENRKINREMNTIISEISLLNSKIDYLIPVAEAAESISFEIADIETRMALMDSLKPKNILYSELIKYLSDNVKNTNSLWVNSFSASGDNFVLSGNSLYRSRIHKFANGLERSIIKNVGSSKIMDKEIYNFDISGKLPGKK